MSEQSTSSTSITLALMSLKDSNSGSLSVIGDHPFQTLGSIHRIDFISFTQLEHGHFNELKRMFKLCFNLADFQVATLLSFIITDFQVFSTGFQYLRTATLLAPTTATKTGTLRAGVWIHTQQCASLIVTHVPRTQQLLLLSVSFLLLTNSRWHPYSWVHSIVVDIVGEWRELYPWVLVSVILTTRSINCRWSTSLSVLASAVVGRVITYLLRLPGHHQHHYQWSLSWAVVSGIVINDDDVT